MLTKQLNKMSQPPRPRRSAFTLIELLLVIAIVAVLGSLAVGVIESAQQDARVSATQARVQMIEKLMETELEDYEVKRSPLPFRNLQAIASRIVLEGQWTNVPASSRLHIRNLKRMLTLDLVRAELPDFRDGVGGDVIGVFPTKRFIDYLTSSGSRRSGVGSNNHCSFSGADFCQCFTME